MKKIVKPLNLMNQIKSIVKPQKPTNKYSNLDNYQPNWMYRNE